MSSNNYSVSVDNDFMSNMKRKVLDEVNRKVSWETDIFKEKADVHITDSATISSPDGEVRAQFSVTVKGVKSYPYLINSYPIKNSVN